MNLHRPLLLCAALVALTACGGGASSSPDKLDLEGTAAAETALSGAAVVVKCAAGSAQTVTGSDGSFAVSMPSGGLPCVLEVSGGGRVYRSAVGGSGNGRFRVNASALTELVVARIAGGGSTPAALFAGFNAGTTAVTPSSVAAAVSYLQTVLLGLTDLSGANPVSDLLLAAHGTSPANALGNQVSSFVAQLAAANVTLDSVAAAVAAGTAGSNPLAPAITAQPVPATAAAPAVATFSVTASGTLPPAYQWQASRDGGNTYGDVVGATGSRYTTPSTQVADSGTLFRVRVYNAVATVFSTSAALTVMEVPAPLPGTVSAGASHTVAVLADGSVLSWGNTKADIGTSLSGLMGVGNDAVVPGTPTVAKNANGTVFSGAKAVAAGQWSTLVLKTDGTVWGWGYSGWGNLGYGTPAFEQKSPVQARLANGSPLSSVVQLAVGSYSTSMAVTSDGSVWGWGQNRYGHLGIGSASDTTGQATPVPMLSPSGVGRFTGARQVAPGISSSAVLATDGTVYTVGWALYGALGDGSTSNRTLPALVQTAPGVALTNVVSVAAGGQAYVAVTAAGTAYTWGDNSKGQLGDGTLTTRDRPVLVRDAGGNPVTGIVAADAGDDYMVFLKSDGTLWAVGNNDIGQLGTNSTAAYLVNPALVVDAAGTTFGSVASVSLLQAHTVVRRRDGSIWTWGNNTYMQLGDMTTVNRRNPLKPSLPSQ